MKYQIAVVAGARPNFMKVAPILRELEKTSQLEPQLIHTGQHYDENLSDVFFEELGIRKPDVALSCSGTTHGQQTASILEQIEKVLLDRCFDAVIVVGDVNSTLAAALAAAKLKIKVAHVEAGLRSFDRTMPEEINRLATDSISDVLLASDPAAMLNLKNEGQAKDKCHLVGNVMIDTLKDNLHKAKNHTTLQRFNLQSGKYATVTLHRPSNVDDPAILKNLMNVLIQVSHQLPLIFPIHPRTKDRLNSAGLISKLEETPEITFSDPLGYLDLLCLNASAKFVITDSGGLQEETTALEVPCLTLRANTERPITVTEGTSTLIGNDAELLSKEIHNVLSGDYKQGRCPKLWDGNAAKRIANVMITSLDAD